MSGDSVIVAQELASKADLQTLRSALEKRLASEADLAGDRLAAVEDDFRKAVKRLEDQMRSVESAMRDQLDSQCKRLESQCTGLTKQLETHRKSLAERLELQEARLDSKGTVFREQMDNYIQRLEALSAVNAEQGARLAIVEKVAKQADFEHLGFAKAVTKDLHNLRDGLRDGLAEGRSWTDTRLQEGFAIVSNSLSAMENRHGTEPALLDGYDGQQVLATQSLNKDSLETQAWDLACTISAGLQRHAENARFQAEGLRSEITAGCEAVARQVHRLRSTMEGLSVELNDVAVAAHKNDADKIEHLIKNLEVQIWPWRSVRQWSRERSASPPGGSRHGSRSGNSHSLALDSRPHSPYTPPRPPPGTSRPTSASLRKHQIESVLQVPLDVQNAVAGAAYRVARVREQGAGIIDPGRPVLQ